MPSGTRKGFGSPTNPKFQFCLAKTDPFGQPTLGITRTYGSDFYTINNIDPRQGDRLIKSMNWNPNIYLNVYITDLRPIDSSQEYGLLGYSSFPIVPDIIQGIPTQEQNALRQIIDGVVINYRMVGKQIGRPVEEEGHVLTHEVGHWLGLFHVFNKVECDFSQISIPDCKKYGDKLCDTPIIEEASDGLADMDNEVVDCGGNFVSAQNYMDYNSTLNFFTEQQVDMMHQKTAFYRSTIYNQTYLNSDCTIKTGELGDIYGSAGGGYGESGSCNGSATDSYAFKIKSDIENGDFGKVLSLDYNKLVVSNPGTRKLNFFTIDECSVTMDSELYMNDGAIVNNVLLKGDFLFVALNSSVLIFQRDENGLWEQIQQINEGDKFGINIAYRGNTLLVTDERRLYAYKFNGNNFSFVGRYSAANADSRIDINALQFNGKIIAIESGANRISRAISIFFINSSENISYVDSSVIDWAETIVLTDDPENFLYTYGYNARTDKQIVTTYDLSSLARGGNNIVVINRVPDFNLFRGNSNWNDPLNFHVYNDYLLMSANLGTSFHKRNTTNYDIVGVYDGNYNSYLQPSPFLSSTSLSKSSHLSGNLLVVGNSYCNEIYIYKLNNFINNLNSNVEICTTPISDYIEGKSIITGGNSCNLDINKRLELRAKESITLRPNTHIKNGTIFSAKINANNCILKGGMIIDEGLLSKRASIDKTFYHNPIQIKVKSELSNSNQGNTENIFFEKKGIIIYPNPTKGILGVQASQKDNVIKSSSVYGVNNVKLVQFENKKQLMSFELDLSMFSTGVYIIKFTLNDGTVISKKVFKE